MIAKVARYLPIQRLTMIVDGLFLLKLRYCLPLFGTVFGLPTLQDGEQRQTAFTKHNLHQLQIIQNKIMRILTHQGFDTPVTQLLSESGMLSVNQLVAYSKVVVVFKVLQSGQPGYFSDRLRTGQQLNRRSHDIIINYNLSVSREGLLYQGALIWNSLPQSLKSVTKTSCFKKQVEEWIGKNIKALP